MTKWLLVLMALVFSTSCSKETLRLNSQTPCVPQNWAENVSYTARGCVIPNDVNELQQLVMGTIVPLKPVGTRHAFNASADTPGIQVSMEKFTGIRNLDSEGFTVTVGAGMRLGDLGKELDARGFALANYPSLPHISVAGSIATATHGSGLENGNLATSVVGIKFVSGEGVLVNATRASHPELFDGMIVTLGAIGFVTEVTMKIEPAYQVRQVVYDRVPSREVFKDLRGIMKTAYSVSLFTDWQNDMFDEVWVKQRVGEKRTLPPTLFGGKRATIQLHPIRSLDAKSTTPQLGVPGPSLLRLPHFRMDEIPSAGNEKELQSEFFVPIDRGVEALQAIFKLKDQITPHLFISEVRAIGSDRLWMSPQYERTSLSIHFTWKAHGKEVAELIPKIENALAPFDARPHWGKLFTIKPPDFARLYPRYEAFKEMRARYDRRNRLQNDYLVKIFGR